MYELCFNFVFIFKSDLNALKTFSNCTFKINIELNLCLNIKDQYFNMKLFVYFNQVLSKEIKHMLFLIFIT